MFEATNEQFETYGDARNQRDADVLAEFAGRACYQSWSRPNEATRKNEDYLRSTVAEKKHESIVAHASVSYYVTDAPRSLTHELIRSRFFAFSELSQRFVDGDRLSMTIHPHGRGDVVAEQVYHDVFYYALEKYRELVSHFEDLEFTHKQAREAARQVLPEGTATEIVVTGNIRAFRDFLRQRWSRQADGAIAEMAGLILQDLRMVAPNSVQDIPEEPYE
jgi:thymidylate synthase (FAD)